MMKKFNEVTLNITVAIIDFLYRGRDYPRFWVLEEIARAPYFAFLSVLHLRESLGLRGPEHLYLMKEHFAQSLNCLLYTSPSPRDVEESRMPSSA